MVEEFKLELQGRTEIGKKAARQLRREGKIPGVFYTGGETAIPFSIDRGHLHQALQSQAHVYAITVGGKKLHAIFKELQYHPVSDEILHVDLFGIRLKDKIDIAVPLVIEGESVGVRMGGVMTQNITELSIRCLASEVPEAIPVDVTELKIGESIHVRNLDLGEIEVLTNPDITIISLLPPKVEVVRAPVEVEEEEVAEEVEAEAAEEGEAPEEAKEDGDKEEKEGSSR